MLVLKNCVLANFGHEAAKKVKAAAPFKLFVDMPLKVFYNYVLWWRRAPAAHRYTQASVFVIACAILAIGFFWRESLFFPLAAEVPARAFQWNSFGYLVIAAAAIILLTLIGFWRGSHRLLRWMILAGLAAVGVALAVYLWSSYTLSENWPTDLGDIAMAALRVLIPAGLLVLGFLLGRWWPRKPKPSPPTAASPAPAASPSKPR